MKSKAQDAVGEKKQSKLVFKDEPGRASANAKRGLGREGGKATRKFVNGRPVSAGPTLGAAAAQAKISPARRVAFEILTLVEQGKGHSDELLHGVRLDDLSEADRHLTTALVMGVLRWQIALDARVRGLLERPEQKLPDAVWLSLRMGAFQLLHMDRIPAHAALSESVEMCRAAGQPHATGMVNAILRKLAAAQKPGTRVFESTAAFAERLGHPLWIVERWVATYGRTAALAICEADQQEPVAEGLFLSIQTDDSANLPQMDEGSRLVAELAAAALPEMHERVARVWDGCAAPGGKTLILALRLPGAKLLATDVSAKRMKLMQARLRRFSYAQLITTGVADASALPEKNGEFDLILCDVPCSGTGTLARNPEIRLRLQPEELLRQADRQRQLLNTALSRLAVGGRLVYSSCSLEPEENEQVLATVDDRYRRVPIVDLLGKVPAIDVPLETLIRNDALRTLPGMNRCDGFYAVVLERSK